MGPRPHSLATTALTATLIAAADLPGAPAPRKTSKATRRASAPYAEKTRGYFNTLSASSVGLEMAVAVIVPMLFGIWLDRKAGTSPWLMLLCLCFGFAAGVRAVWRYVAAANREVAESEQERDAERPRPRPRRARRLMTGHGIRRIERLNYILGGIAIIVGAVTVARRPALGLALGVVLTCLNFAALRWLVFRWTAAVKAGDEGGGNRIYLLLPKMVGMMGAVALIVIFLPIDAIGFLIGYSIFLPSIVIGSLLEAFSPSPADEAPPTGGGTAPPPSPTS